MSTLEVKSIAAPTGYTLGMPAGHIIQVVTGTTSSATVVSTTGSWVSTDLSASITPSSSSNKIYIQVCGSQYADADDQSAAATIFRGSTNLGTDGYGLAPFYVNGLSGAIDLQSPTSMSYLDSPSSTSSTTYTVKCKTDKNTYRWNGIRATTSTITLMEVQG
jgi:hypothetical protein